MPSQKTATKQALRVIRERNGVRGKNPRNALLNQLPDVTPEQLDSSLETLEEQGLIVRTKDNGRVVKIGPAKKRRPRSPRYIHPDDKSAWAKREARYAKGTPAYLPDELCSEVVVSHVSDRKTPDKEKMVSEELPYHEVLTQCLNALRAMANENGYADSTSVRSVLECVEYMSSPSRVARAMTHLSGMGVYSTKMVGYRVSSYQLDLGITEITAGMVQRYRSGQKKQPTSQVAEPVAADVPTAETPDDAMQSMANIIETLEAKVADLEQGLTVLDNALEQAQADNRRLTKLLADEKAHSGALEERLNRTPQHDPRIASILKRHGVTAS